MNNIKQTLAKVVSSVNDTAKGKKSTGTVIGQITRDTPVTVIAPFSL